MNLRISYHMNKSKKYIWQKFQTIDLEIIKNNISTWTKIWLLCIYNMFQAQNRLYSEDNANIFKHVKQFDGFVGKQFILAQKK